MNDNNTAKDMQDLAPDIYRQRIVIEGHSESVITDEEIRTYLTQLSQVIDMKALTTPVTHKSSTYGWAGWIHWETSGAHFYAWDDSLFFSVDVYSCKPFVAESAVEYTQDYFHTSDIVWKKV